MSTLKKGTALKRKRLVLPAFVAAVTAGLVLAIGASGASLAGSNFEIDGNLIVNGGAGALDWANVAQNKRADAPTGANDDSYKGGVKEDTVCPGEVTGSIPNNNSDLLEFGGYAEAEADGPGWLHVYWARVNDPSGTTNMDFEFNRSTTACSEGPNIVRTEGDVLLQFDVDQGGANATLSRRTWLASGQWSDATPLGTTEAIGAINQVSIPFGQSDGLITSGSLAPRTFGEASFDLSAVTGGDTCLAFGSAMLKSRSSDSFTSQLKDFIRPISLSNNNCGAIKIVKERKHAASGAGDHPHAGVTFDVGGQTVVTDANGEACVDGLALGDEVVITETVPEGYNSDDSVKEVTPTVAASCDDDPYGGSTVNFLNTPLTDVDISITSQVTGGTSNTLDCDGTALDDMDGGNVTVSVDDLEPTSASGITCTLVIDP
jgi:hypothetical protein